MLVVDRCAVPQLRQRFRPHAGSANEARHGWSAAAWGLLVSHASPGFGILAWGIGGLIGFAIVRAGGRGTFLEEDFHPLDIVFVLLGIATAFGIVSKATAARQVAALKKAVALIRDHQTDLATFLTESTQGQKLPLYLEQLATHLLQERDDLVHETTDLSHQIDHMKEIVSRQQSYARVSGTTSRGHMSQIVDDVLALQSASFQKHDIRVHKRIEADPECDIDRSRVMQVLMNLLANARQSLCERNSGGAICEIVLQANGPDRIRLTVTDNGVGIPPEHLTRVFAHGFTTKKEGHGFGLHHSANAATEMGGRLWAESPGVGKGATFVLELPTGATTGARS